MLTITDINGNTEGLTGYKNLKRYRNVSGEKSLAFFVIPTSQNAHSFGMVSEESIVEFAGESYRIKQIAEKPKGPTYYKEVVAVHMLFDLIDDHKYELHNGSLTFASALSFVLDGTGYTWNIVDSFSAQDWQNFGDDNRLALLQDVLKRYGAEFTLSGTQFTFRKRIGNATDFQFRYNYNVKTLAREVNTNNLATYIKGFGKQNEDGTYVVQSEYTSPNSAVFGIRHAKPLRDERYTTQAGLDAALISALIDTPEVSITVDFADMRRAGYPYDVPNEGDDVFLIYEPMGIDVEARLMEVTEEFTEGSDLPTKTAVTLSNIRNNITDKWLEFSQTQKQVGALMNGTAKLPYNVLDDAVKRATEALQSAQTELEFNNGIIARDPSNPNNLVLFTSAGLGVSTDGGATFKEAITKDGFVLSAGAIGQLAANNIQIGEGTTFAGGYDPTAVNQGIRNDLRLNAPLPTNLTMNQDGITASASDPSKYARLDYRGLYVNNGAIQVKRSDGYVTMIDGMINQDFNVQGATPPFLVNAEILGRHFKTTYGAQSPGICQVFTFKKTARYLKFHVNMGVDTDLGNQAKAFVEQTGVPGVWLGSATATANISTGEEKWITVDLGTPDGSDFAVYLKLYTTSTDTGAYLRVIRTFLTDF